MMLNNYRVCRSDNKMYDSFIIRCGSESACGSFVCYHRSASVMKTVISRRNLLFINYAQLQNDWQIHNICIKLFNMIVYIVEKFCWVILAVFAMLLPSWWSSTMTLTTSFTLSMRHHIQNVHLTTGHERRSRLIKIIQLNHCIIWLYCHSSKMETIKWTQTVCVFDPIRIIYIFMSMAVWEFVCACCGSPVLVEFIGNKATLKHCCRALCRPVVVVDIVVGYTPMRGTTTSTSQNNVASTTHHISTLNFPVCRLASALCPVVTLVRYRQSSFGACAHTNILHKAAASSSISEQRKFK